jgi:hypothetical protein
MSHLKSTKIITAILPKGIALEVVGLLKNEKGIITANTVNARGIGKMMPLKYRGVGEQTEREVLTVVVPEERGEEIFEYMYFTAGINKPHGGIILMSSILSSEYQLPEGVEDER